MHNDPTCPHCHQSLRVEPKCGLCNDTGRVTKTVSGPHHGGYWQEPCPKGCAPNVTILYGRNAA